MGQYYKWHQLFMDGALKRLRHKKNGRETGKEEKFRAQNERVKGMIAELASENLQLKKSWGITGHIEDQGKITMIKAEVQKTKEKTGLKTGHKKLTYQMHDEGIVALTPHRYIGYWTREKSFINGARPERGQARNTRTSQQDLMNTGIQTSCISRSWKCGVF